MTSLEFMVRRAPTTGHHQVVHRYDMEHLILAARPAPLMTQRVLGTQSSTCAGFRSQDDLSLAPFTFVSFVFAVTSMAWARKRTPRIEDGPLRYPISFPRSCLTRNV
jgi:hypothetical protein